MNLFVAKITEIKSVQNLNILKFECMGTTLSMMSLELDARIKVGTSVKLSSKPIHVAIAKEFSGSVSYSNQLPVEVISVDNGELLASIKLNFQGILFESIITRESSDRMSLHVDNKVTALIKANDLSIVDVLDD